MTRLIDANAIEVHTSSDVIRHIVMDTIDAQPTVDAIPLDWIMKWYQRRISGRTNGKYIMRTVIRELLDAWDAESGGNAGTKGDPCSNCQEFDCYGCEFERDGDSDG